MTQTRQCARSTKPKPTTEDAPPNIINPLLTAKAKEIYVYTDPIIKLYNHVAQDCGDSPSAQRDTPTCLRQVPPDP